MGVVLQCIRVRRVDIIIREINEKVACNYAILMQYVGIVITAPRFRVSTLYVTEWRLKIVKMYVDGRIWLGYIGRK